VSTHSYREQGYDVDPGTVELQQRLDALNDAYEARFGFRFVVFVNGQPTFSGPPTKGKKAKLLPLQLDQYTQMEANFAFFFGLAVQSYESTLVSDDSPFDRYAQNPYGYPQSSGAVWASTSRKASA